jgi:hypothetical protein
MVITAGSGLFLPSIYAFPDGRARKKQELKGEDCQNPSPQWNIIRIIPLYCPLKNIIMNVIPDVV